MPRSTEVKFFTFEMRGAPSFTAAAGSVKNILKACLVEGFGAIDITGISVSGNVATVTTSGDHSFPKHSVIEISGSENSFLNGQHRITELEGTTQFRIETVSVADGNYSTSGASVKIASAGWKLVGESGNKAALQTGLDEAIRSVGHLIVDDENRYFCDIDLSEDFRDFNNTYTTLNSGVTKWFKSFYTSSQPSMAWGVVANEHFVWFTYNVYNVYRGMATSLRENCWGGHFGEIYSRKANDKYKWILKLDKQQGSSEYTTGVSYWSPIDANQNARSRMQRSYTGLKGSIDVYRTFISSSSYSSGNYTNSLQYPNGPDYSIPMFPVYVVEDSSGALRGQLPGVMMSPTNCGSYGYGFEIFENIDEVKPDNLIIAVGNSNNNNNNNNNNVVIFLNATQWRPTWV